ncbi:MAG: vitamin K epoxide reductase family protein [Ectothiorhodospiraceae bacterium]|nr:vitamin K epoxide reductase family protein [Chromatiales bacterium]MCP5154156.1 vitamin K epoxide reductase family protein [Ectothiorhodospiraceae bacterium]
MKRTRGKRQSAARPQSPAATATAAGGGLSTTVLVLVAAGVVLTAYLTGVAWFGAHPLYCGEGSGCDVVQASRWSRLLGVPMSAWGLLTYALIGGLVWRARRRPGAWRLALLVAVCGLAVSVYLTAVSVMEIEATCGYCLASLGLMTAIVLLLVASRPAGLVRTRWLELAAAPASAAVVVVVALHMHFSGLFDPAAGPEQPRLRALAEHLTASGAKFYGAYWCPHCQDQKKLFGASAERLPYVECSPEGRGGPQSAACGLAGVRDYPSWDIGGRRYGGVLEIPLLERLSDFRFAE